jgi:putative flippase GtrA
MTAILKNPLERTRFIKFAIVGAIGALIDFGVMNLLVWLLKATLVLAGSVSFICAVISNFTWNRFWTYPESRTKHVVGQLIQFTFVNAIGLLIRIPILKLGEPALDHLLEQVRTPLLANSHTFISHNATLAIAIGVVMLWNYFVNRYWTYNDIDA